MHNFPSQQSNRILRNTPSGGRHERRTDSHRSSQIVSLLVLLTKPATPFAQSRLLCLAFHNKSELKFRMQMSLNINNSAYCLMVLMVSNTGFLETQGRGSGIGDLENQDRRSRIWKSRIDDRGSGKAGSSKKKMIILTINRIT